MGAAGGIIGGSFSAIGQMRASDDAKAAHFQNKNNIEQQMIDTQAVYKRKDALLKRSQDKAFDRQKSQFARSGVSFDGSVIDFLGDTKVEQENERRALAAETGSEMRSLRMRAANEQKALDDIADWAMFDTIGAFFGSSSKYIGSDSGNSSGSTATTSAARSK